MYQFQQQYSARTILEQEDGKKFVFIDHPDYGQHRFSLPTKEEIYKDYSYFSEPSKKKCINSFMIFRTYLQKSKQNQNYLVLGEVSKFASTAWSFATKDVKDACDELEKKLRDSFIHKRFIPYTHSPKKPKKIRPSKKESSSSYALTSSRDQVYYPSPMISREQVYFPSPNSPDQVCYPSPNSPNSPMTQVYYPSPVILPGLMYPDSSMISPITPFDSSQMNALALSMISPPSLQTTPFDSSQINVPLLILPSSMISPPSLQTTPFDSSQMNIPSLTLQSSMISPPILQTTPFDSSQMNMSSSLTFPPSSITPMSSDQNQLSSLTPSHILESGFVQLPDGAATESLAGAQSTWSFESLISPEEHQF